MRDIWLLIKYCFVFGEIFFKNWGKFLGVNVNVKYKELVLDANFFFFVDEVNKVNF